MPCESFTHVGLMFSKLMFSTIKIRDDEMINKFIFGVLLRAIDSVHLVTVFGIREYLGVGGLNIFK